MKALVFTLNDKDETLSLEIGLAGVIDTKIARGDYKEYDLVEGREVMARVEADEYSIGEAQDEL